MKKLFVIAALAALAVCQCFAQSKTPALIKVEHAGDHLNEIVRVMGIVGARLTPPAPDSAEDKGSVEFQLVGDTVNDNILVIHSQMGYPIHGSSYTFLGHLVTRSNGTETYLALIEQKGWPMNKTMPVDPDRTVLCRDDSECTGEPVAAIQPPPPPKNPGIDPIVLALLIATGVIVIALFVVLVKVLSGSKESGTKGFEMEQGHTVQVYRGTAQAIKEGTVKVLPGRFEVVEADGSTRDVRLSISSANPGREFLITRSTNGQMPLNAIAFKDMTVSTNQGKLICANDGRFTVINYADPIDRNPIILNGRTLAKNESSPLSDNDQMMIGSVKLVYHVS